jgi:hypothetical protein
MNRISTAEGVAAEVTRRMELILKSGGFETDAGQKVYRGKRKVDEEKVGTGCLVLIEGDDDPVARPGRQPLYKNEQTYILGGYLPCSAEHPNDAAHALIRDLKRAIFSDPENFGGAVDNVAYRGRDIGPRADGVNIVFAMIEIVVTFVEDLRKP